MNYNFPVKDKFHARIVTQFDFDIAEQETDVYVHLDKVRDTSYIDDMKFCLNIDGNGALRESSDTFEKIIFSGHRGSGKTSELLRFHKNIDNPSKYFSVFIEIEKELEVGRFQPYDVFVLLITKLVEKIDDKDIDFKSDYLDKIKEEWFSDKEIIKELHDNYRVDVASEASIEASIPFFLKLKSSIRAIFCSESKTSKIIRRKIKHDPATLIDKFNAVLQDLRKTLINYNYNDILFILDGTEKIPYSVYKQLFVEDSYLIRTINVNMIFSVPINSYFDIQGSTSSDFFQAYTLPMIPVNEKSFPLLEQIITKRIDKDTFLEPEAIKLCIEKSGGCIRQLIQIVNRSLIMSRGAKITMEIVKKCVEKLGRAKLDLFDSEHLEILLKGKFNTSNQKTLDLLYSLSVLKYNGERKINPLIVDLLEQKNENQ